MRINQQNNKQNFKALSSLARPLGQFYNANATIPTLVIETGVTLGRANEAKKRGGTPEAIDRLVEQGISAVVWIYGVKILKSIGDFIGKKALKIKDLDFDIGFDDLRNPIKNLDKKSVAFKASNILTSTAIATYFIGAILPKINNAILAKTLKKEEAKNKENVEKTTLKETTFEDFQKQTNKNISFTSLYDAINTSAHVLENNSAMRLLITDTGVIAGRFHNAPNKYRKIEGLFRDISSIYFYLLSTSHIVKGLNKIFSNTDINPKTLEKTLKMLQDKVQEGISADEFLKNAKNNQEINLDDVFENKNVVEIEKLIKKFPSLEEKILKMSELQPLLEGKKVISKQQAQDVLSTSWVSNPEFLKDMFEYTTDGASSKASKFVSRKHLEGIRKSIDNFIEQVASSAKKDNCKITKEYLEKIANSTIKKNFAFNALGTAISIFALGSLIPKIQYAITRKMTNENKFHTENDK